MEDCINAVDEEACDSKGGGQHNIDNRVIPHAPPAILNFNGRGKFTVTRFPNGTSNCPDTHFQCPDNGYCLPVYVRCNGVMDCPGHEDEAWCKNFTCAGFYRCRASKICLHPSQMCDGWSQCPKRDDELLCNFICPQACTCHGLAFTCSDLFPSHLHPELRFLDGSGSGMSPSNLTHNLMLIHLSLSECLLTHLANLSLPNLLSVDLRNNLLTDVTYHHLKDVSNLQILKLAGNPLTSVFLDADQHQPLNSVLSLDLSNITMKILNTDNLIGFHNAHHLNLSHNRVQKVQGLGFESLKELRVLDLDGCDMHEFPRTIFQGLANLQTVYASNYKLCCPATLPVGFDVNHCHAPFDELSSCESLLRSPTYRVFLVMFIILGFFGNLGSLVMRSCFEQRSSKSGFSVLVSYLCVGDLLMGFYLMFIGVADRVYQDRYLWEDKSWKESAVCELAGFLSVTSNEVSASIICLITMDRFLVLRFPFSQLHLHRGSAHIVSMFVFLLGFSLAAVPWLPVNRHWHFYNQNGICIPLPITRSEFAGHNYSFGVMIILNLVLFLLIAAGQASIYVSIHTNAMTDVDVSRRSQDLRIAQRLVSIAMSDFLCWFPIGLLGVLSSYGVSVPGEVNVGIAIFVLPLNSALNPFLYTLNILLDRLNQRKESELLRILEKQANDV